MSLLRGQQSKMKSRAQINMSACITQCEERVEQVKLEVTGQQPLTITLIQCQGGIWRLHWMLVITVVTFPGGHTEFSLWCQSKTSKGVFSPEHLFNRVPREWVGVGGGGCEDHQSMCTIAVNSHSKHFNQSKSHRASSATSPANVFQVSSLRTISVKNPKNKHFFISEPAPSPLIPTSAVPFVMWLLCHGWIFGIQSNRILFSGLTEGWACKWREVLHFLLYQNPQACGPLRLPVHIGFRRFGGCYLKITVWFISFLLLLRLMFTHTLLIWGWICLEVRHMVYS